MESEADALKKRKKKELGLTCMKAIKIILIDVFLTIADITTDILNGIRMIRKGEEKYGYICIGLVWLPGFLIAIWLVFRWSKSLISTRNTILFGITGGLCFPVWLPILYIYSIYLMSKDEKKFNEVYVYAIFFKALEGIAEAAPQLVFNTYTILIMGEADYMQIFSLSFSLISLTKTSSENHFIELRLKIPQVKQIFGGAVFFLIHTLYRFILYGVLVAYLREWFLAVLIINALITTFVARRSICTHVICTFWTSIGALFSACAFKHIEEGIMKGPGSLDLPDLLSFYFWNSVEIFLIGTTSLILLTVFLEAGVFEPEPMPFISCHPSVESHNRFARMDRICEGGERPYYYLEVAILPALTIFGLLAVNLAYLVWHISNKTSKRVTPIIQSKVDGKYRRMEKVISDSPSFLAAGSGWKEAWIHENDEATLNQLRSQDILDLQFIEPKEDVL